MYYAREGPFNRNGSFVKFDHSRPQFLLPIISYRLILHREYRFDENAVQLKHM